MHVPSDRKILSTIYNLYYKDFKDFDESNRSVKIYVPIDCELVGDKLKVDRDIIFGRLYYYFNKKYGYKKDNGNQVEFILPKLGEQKNCINFPLLSSVLAGLLDENRKFNVTIVISIFALVISVGASVISIITS